MIYKDYLLRTLICKDILLPDLPTVSETATEPPQEEPTSLNSSKNLALEAMAINHNFSQQALKMVGGAHLAFTK